MSTYSAFEGSKLLTQGSLDEVVLRIKRRHLKDENSAILIFSDDTGRTMDFNFQGSEKEVLKRLEIYVEGEPILESTGPGRPKLGVISREVSLLPRHWEWLANQSGGASAALRKLVEEAKKKSSATVTQKQAQERAYKFMHAMAGDMEGFEEALRALYRKDVDAFKVHIDSWPKDVRNHTLELAEPVFF
jgi:uncharacterized protein